jgi:hypothetical protein
MSTHHIDISLVVDARAGGSKPVHRVGNLIGTARGWVAAQLAPLVTATATAAPVSADAA